MTGKLRHFTIDADDTPRARRSYEGAMSCAAEAILGERP